MRGNTTEPKVRQMSLHILLILTSQSSDSFINNHWNTVSHWGCLYSLNARDVEADVSHKYLELRKYTTKAPGSIDKLQKIKSSVIGVITYTILQHYYWTPVGFFIVLI